MASSAAVAVSTTAVAVATGNGTRRDVAIYNTGPNTVYLGGAGVTSANGFPVAASTDLVYPLGQSEALYAICATAESATLRVLANNS